MLHFLITTTKQMFSHWKNVAGLRHAKICQLISFIYTNKIIYDEYDELHLVFDRYDIPKSLKSEQGICGLVILSLWHFTSQMLHIFQMFH